MSLHDIIIIHIENENIIVMKVAEFENATRKKIPFLRICERCYILNHHGQLVFWKICLRDISTL